MGVLGVELVDAKGLQGSDRSGKSDVSDCTATGKSQRRLTVFRFRQPYVVFNLVGEKVFKSQVKKKTLAPSWNERFEVAVPSRSSSRLTFEIFDWNQVSDAATIWSPDADPANLS